MSDGAEVEVDGQGSAGGGAAAGGGSAAGRPVARQVAQAERLRSLHRPGAPLVLPNAWDAASARVVEAAGAPAVATSSAGVSYAYGVPDGEMLGRDEAVAAVARIVRAVRVPVTADVEAGYGTTPDDVAATMAAVVAAGAVGVNVEDQRPSGTLFTVEEQCERLAAVRAAFDRAGVPAVVNARVDVYMVDEVPAAERYDEAVRRALAYLDAGGDCAFVPGTSDEQVIRGLAEATGGRLSVLAGGTSPPVATLASWGVCRISVGSATARAAYALARRAATEMLGPGTFGTLTDAIPYPEMQALLG